MNSLSWIYFVTIMKIWFPHVNFCTAPKSNEQIKALKNGLSQCDLWDNRMEEHYIYHQPYLQRHDWSILQDLLLEWKTGQPFMQSLHAVCIERSLYKPSHHHVDHRFGLSGFGGFEAVLTPSSVLERWPGQWCLNMFMWAVYTKLFMW